jgi:peptidoglycan/xylan/chitin deacetylase (PgdA/CDA1 family)
MAMNSIPIYTYHSIDESNSFISLSARVFESQMTYLRRRGWRCITLPELAGLLRGREEIPAKTFAVTFDDGYKNNLEVAYPILEAGGYTATIFVATAYVGNENSWIDNGAIPRIQMLSWADIKYLKRNGFDIQPHGDRHIPLAGLDRSVVEKEVSVSRDLIEAQLGGDADLFCYPHGKFDRQVISVLESRGFTAALTTRLGCLGAGDDPFRLCRVGTRFFRKYPSLFPLSTAAWGMRLLKTLVAVKKKGTHLS